MASYNTIPKTEEEPLIADAPKASHKSTAVIAAVCLLSAVAGFNNHKIINTLFYKKGQVYLNALDEQVCLSVKNKEATQGAKMQVWNCNDDVGKIFTKKWITKSGAFNLEYQDSNYCVVGKTAEKGMKSGTQLYLYECKEDDPTQQWVLGGRHMYFQGVKDSKDKPTLCMTASGTSEGDKVTASTCSWSQSMNDMQKWAFSTK
jgi:hypothetical protein